MSKDSLPTLVGKKWVPWRCAHPTHPFIILRLVMPVSLTGGMSLFGQGQLNVLTRTLTCSLGALAMTETITYTSVRAGVYCSPPRLPSTPSPSRREVSCPVRPATQSPAHGSTWPAAETGRTNVPRIRFRSERLEI